MRDGLGSGSVCPEQQKARHPACFFFGAQRGFESESNTAVRCSGTVAKREDPGCIVGEGLGPPGSIKLHEWQKCSAYSYNLRIHRTFFACILLRRRAGRAAAPTNAGAHLRAHPYFATDPSSISFPVPRKGKEMRTNPPLEHQIIPAA